MEHIASWEANRFSAIQEIPRNLCNPKVHYRIHKCPPPVLILSQINPVHVLTFHFLKIHLNIILPSTPGSSQIVSLPQVSPSEPCIPLSYPPYMLHVPPMSFFSIWPKVSYMSNLKNIFFFSFRYSAHQGFVFYSPLAGFSLLADEVSWLYTTTRHTR